MYTLDLEVVKVFITIVLWLGPAARTLEQRDNKGTTFQRAFLLIPEPHPCRRTHHTSHMEFHSL